MKLLLTGKNGQLGFELQRALMPLGDLIATSTIDFDLGNETEIRRILRNVRPDVIVNAAAFTAVDKAEKNIMLANAINTNAPGILSQEAHHLGALLVHYSTDYVFDGNKSGPYCETDTPNPINVYGISKLNGEKVITANCDRYLILRTSWVVGAHGNNFAKTILRMATEDKPLNIVVDQFGVPTPAALIADITAHLIHRAEYSSHDFPYGLYHAVAAGETNWHEYACYVIEYARRAGKSIRVALDEIKPVMSADYPSAAKRPTNSRLDSTLLRQTFGIHLPHWKTGIDHIVEQLSYIK